MMTRTLVIVVVGMGLMGCGDDTSMTEGPMPIALLQDVLGIEDAAAEDQLDLHSDRMWDYTVPHDRYDPYPRGGQPLELEAIPESPVVWLVWQRVVEVLCNTRCYRSTKVAEVQEVLVYGDSFPGAFQLKVDPDIAPEASVHTTVPEAIGIEAGTPALAMAYITLPTEETRARYEEGDETLILTSLQADEVLGVSDHYLVWIEDAVEEDSPAGWRFNSALAGGYHLVPRFRDRRLECEDDEWWSCGDPELAWLPILDLDDDIGLFTGDWQSLYSPIGFSDDPI